MISTETKTIKNTNNTQLSETENIINISYASDKNYAKYLALSMSTVLNSKAPEDNINFYILDGGLTEKDKSNILDLKKIANCKIDFINVNQQKFKNCPLENTTYLSIASYYRLLLPDFLQDINKILYLDCDTEIKGSLRELYNTDLGDQVIAGATDITAQIHIDRLNLTNYINSGVLVIDLNKMRELKFTDNVFNWIASHKEILERHDQDVINIYFKNKIKIIDKKWNTQSHYHSKDFKTLYSNAIICHHIAYDKGSFVSNSLPLIFKTKYKYALIQVLLFKYLKTMAQNIFMIRRLDNCTKSLTLLGFNFKIKCKPKINETDSK